MERFHKAKLAMGAFRCYASKIIPKTPFQHSSSTFRPSCKSAYSISSHSYPTSSIFQRFDFKRIHHDPFPAGGCSRRFYCLDHFKLRGPRGRFQISRIVLIVVVVGSSIFTDVYFGPFPPLETVPYTKREHSVLLSESMERKLGELEFKLRKKGFEEEILPATHPESVRVHLIAKEIIEALQRGLKQEGARKDMGYASLDSVMEGNAGETSRESMGKEGQVDTKTRTKALQKGSSEETFHLDGLNWEVLVVDKPIASAFCLPGGKIVVYTGLLNRLKTDAKIATVIAHEVGHVVASHKVEGFTRGLSFTIAHIILSKLLMPDLVTFIMPALFSILIFSLSRRMEREADHIGLLLMASAGYDPRVAPLAYEKLEKVEHNPISLDFRSTNSFVKTRSELLAQANVMEEALVIYRENNRV